MATAKCGLGVKSEGELIISGTQGYAIVKAPWWKTTDFEIRYEDPNANEKYFAKFLGDGLRYEIGDFLSYINNLGEKHMKLKPEESVFLADIMEQFLQNR